MYSHQIGLLVFVQRNTRTLRSPTRAQLIGHVPMLADPDFARMVQAIGVASLGAEEKTIWHLTKVYWYTVEFGVVREGGAVKAFGAGVLSSYGELDWMARGGAELAPFDPYAKQPKMRCVRGAGGPAGGYAWRGSFSAGGSLLPLHRHLLRAVREASTSAAGLLVWVRPR
jgi:hypothetical protein